MAIVDATAFEAPGRSGSPVGLQERYGNFIGGEWVAPSTGEYRENLTRPPVRRFARSRIPVRRTLSWRWMRRMRRRMGGVRVRRLSVRPF